jgi:glycosyltransferase involved in cell wall biosynthesis
VLHAAAAVVVTSRWSRDWLVGAYRLPPQRVLVVPPGVDRAEVVPGSAEGGRLVVVGAVTPVKGHDLLVAALQSVADLRWSCTVVGSTSIDPAFVARVRGDVLAAGLQSRVRLPGPRAGSALDAVYAAADLVVVPSRVETYGMVVTEALARAVPVVAAAVGGLPEAMGTAPGARRPGLLVAPDDPGALAAALRCWLTDAELRDALRSAARSRREALAGWRQTGGRLSALLAEVAA